MPSRHGCVKMSYVDLEGTKGNSFPKVLLPRESTVAIVTDVSSWSGSKKVKNPDGSILEKPSEKIIITAQVDKDKTVSCWMNSLCKKGSKPSYDTLSYTNAVNLNLLDKLKKVQDKLNTLEDITAFWKTELLGKKIKFVPETVVPENGERYSIIKIVDAFA
jgi:hypothetical protein